MNKTNPTRYPASGIFRSVIRLKPRDGDRDYHFQTGTYCFNLQRTVTLKPEPIFHWSPVINYHVFTSHLTPTIRFRCDCRLHDKYPDYIVKYLTAGRPVGGGAILKNVRLLVACIKIVCRTNLKNIILEKWSNSMFRACPYLEKNFGWGSKN